MAVKHNETVLKDLEVGDLIEFPRTYYSHWGVYVGDEEVVHVERDVDGIDGTNDNSDSAHSRHFNKACVKVDNFWDVAGQSRVKKNNDQDKKYPPFPPEKIKERAFSKLGAIPYNAINSNSEHFATWCRNGENRSQQVDTALDWITGFGVAMLVCGIEYVLNLARKKTDKEQPKKS